MTPDIRQSGGAPQKGTPQYNRLAYVERNKRAAHRCVDCGKPIAYCSERCPACNVRNVVVPNRRVRSDGWTRESAIAALQTWAARHGGFAPLSDIKVKNESPRIPSRKTVERLFGSWNAGVAAAGLHARSPGETETRPSGRTDGPRTRNRQMVRAGTKGATVIYSGTATAKDHKIP